MNSDLPFSTAAVLVRDERGQPHKVLLAQELPLTIHLNDQEIVTLMSLREYPDALGLGYLINQQYISGIEEITRLRFDDGHLYVSTNSAATSSKPQTGSGCSIGSSFKDHQQLQAFPDGLKPLSAAAVLAITTQTDARETAYRLTGTVHSCALASNDGARSKVIAFVEDVSRHNAVDSIAGMMAQRGLSGADKVFYTTGRLTAEIILKVARMGIPNLISRSMITRMSYDLAYRLNMTLIGRARQKQFCVFSDNNRFRYD